MDISQQQALSFLTQRISSPKLLAPGPSQAELESMLRAAMRAPDHGEKRPWRFLTIAGAGREALGELYVKAAQARGEVISEKLRAKYRAQPLRAPLVVVVIATITVDAKVPRDEQIVAAGCSAYGLLLAADALGYAGIWRTGINAVDATVKQGLELASNEEIVGFIYLGTRGSNKVADSVSLDNYVASWPG